MVKDNKIDKYREEFDDLLISDTKFNYDENEFKEWLKDYELKEMEEDIKGKLFIEGGLNKYAFIKIINGNEIDIIDFLRKFKGEEVEIKIRTINGKRNKIIEINKEDKIKIHELLWKIEYINLTRTDRLNARCIRDRLEKQHNFNLDKRLRKEEVEEGCGNEIISYARVKGICGQTSRILKEVVSMYCQECQETLKILNERLVKDIVETKGED